ncbi:hypothetical protein [Thermosediminibacter oceani]|uniref:Uncharacterized protein n=1 Tax=Thermosediminibacter oceani (strain ATCC BAA-1034 / DSM 16646 / JW/IW-1228P) TaxID=555079 RepID=D9S3B1_THEOJ|nr:hypothetical protein [Thermosediminibacter oceani]ADL07888.1 conserved hypothetical protein [Thermosediminibacter oceani DSM 16646]
MRPVDLQVVIPKVTEVSKNQQVLKDAGEAGQSIMASQFQEQLRVMKQKVNLPPKAERLQVTPDRRENREREKDKNREKSRNGRHVDLKI